MNTRKINLQLENKTPVSSLPIFLQKNTPLLKYLDGQELNTLLQVNRTFAQTIFKSTQYKLTLYQWRLDSEWVNDQYVDQLKKNIDAQIRRTTSCDSRECSTIISTAVGGGCTCGVTCIGQFMACCGCCCCDTSWLFSSSWTGGYVSSAGGFVNCSCCITCTTYICNPCANPCLVGCGMVGCAFLAAALQFCRSHTEYKKLPGLIEARRNDMIGFLKSEIAFLSNPADSKRNDEVKALASAANNVSVSCFDGLRKFLGI